MTVDDLDPVELGVLLSELPPDHLLACAARIALGVGEARHARRVALPNSAHDVPRTADCWARWLGEFAELPRRRLVACEHIGDDGVCHDCAHIWVTSRAEMARRPGDTRHDHEGAT